MAHLAGNTVVDIITPRDPFGDPVSGCTATVVYARRQDGTAIDVSIVEAGTTGSYVVQYAAPVRDDYHVVVILDKEGMIYQFSGTTHVVSLSVPFDAYLNQPFSEVLYLADENGDPITGRTVTATNTRNPDGDAFTITGGEIAGNPGVYVVTTTPLDGVGTYTGDIMVNTTPERRYQFEMTVINPNPVIVEPLQPITGNVLWSQVITQEGSVTWTKV